MLLKIKLQIDRCLLFFKEFWVDIYWHNVLDGINKNGYVDVESFSRKSWHDGFFYFVGVNKNEKKVFIKCQFFGLDVLNDIHFNKKIKEIGLKSKLCEIYDSFKINNTEVVVFEYIEKSNEKVIDEKILSIIFNDIWEINEAGYILRDFKLDNIIISSEEIYLIDFTFAYQDKEESSYIVLKNEYIKYVLGSDKRPMDFVWDDMFSLSVICSDMEISSTLKNKIKDKINKNYIKLNV